MNTANVKLVMSSYGVSYCNSHMWYFFCCIYASTVSVSISKLVKFMYIIYKIFASYVELFTYNLNVVFVWYNFVAVIYIILCLWTCNVV